MTAIDSMELLLDRINDAFGKETAPPADDVAYAPQGTHMECDDVRRAFAGKDWRSLGADDLLQNKEALDFMTPRAFRFYLPAYLRFSVEHFTESDVIPDTILGILLPTVDEQLKKWRKERLDALSTGEAYVLRAFVEFLRERHRSEFDEETLNAAMAQIDSGIQGRRP
jgi:hypothetical protein